MSNMAWHDLGTLNDCEYTDHSYNPRTPYGYVGPVEGGWETSIWHPRRREWCGVRGMPFATRDEARSVVERVCNGLMPRRKRALSGRSDPVERGERSR